MSLITSWLDSNAAKKENKKKQQLLDYGATLTRDEFNRRMAEILASDDRILDLSREEYGQTAAAEDATFADLLGLAGQGFDERLTISDQTADARTGVAKDAFDQQMLALNGLMTQSRGAKLMQQQAAEAERVRQKAFQDQADSLAEALPGQIGYDAQDIARQQSLADRVALIEASTSKPAAPVWARDGAAGEAFAAQDARGTAVGQGDAKAAARVSSYGDAFQGAERNMAGFADDIGALGQKAQISRSALPAELGVGGLKARQAQERADFATSLAREMGDRYDQIAADRGRVRQDTSAEYFGQNTNARERAGQNTSDLLSKYFGDMFGAEGGFINGLTAASQNLESKLLNLNNFKMGNTSVTSPLANTIREAERAAAAAMGRS